MAGDSKRQPQTVLIVGSYAPSLINFRGAFIRALVERGHQVTAAAPSLDGMTRHALQKLGAAPAAINLSNASLNPLSTIASYRSICQLVEDVHPDVVVAYTIKPVILCAIAAKSRGVRRMVALITGLGFAFTEGGGFKRLVSRLAATLLYKVALRRADVALFQNPDDLALFRRIGLLAKGKQVGIINGSGIDIEHFTPRGMPATPSFLMIARLLKDKGVREFAAAAKRIKAEYPQATIALAGYLDPSPDSISQAELDQMEGTGIRFLGKLDDVRSAMADSSVYVLPSYREGTPRSVLEAMAMGRAIITTEAPGCRETVVNGRNGFLVPPRDVEALRLAMVRFIDQPELAARMGAESRIIAEEKYDVRKVNAALMTHAGL